MVGIKLYTAALIVCLLLSACLFSRREAAPLPELTGTWRGAVQDSVSGGGTLALDLVRLREDEGFRLRGTWQLDFEGSTRAGDIAYGGGAENGLSLRLDAAPNCSYDFEGSVRSRVIRGTYLTEGCAPYAVGTLELEKQP